MNEDGDNVHQPRNKTMVFTLEERKLLVKLVNMYYDVLNNKKVDSASTQLKNNAWEAIHKKYLENTGLIKLPRTPQQLKRCWENMKCKAKKGDPMTVKLLRWGEAQYKLLKNRTQLASDKVNGTSNPDSFEEDSDLEVKDVLTMTAADKVVKTSTNLCSYGTNMKAENFQDVSPQKLDDPDLKLKEDLESSEFGPCSCEKDEKCTNSLLLAMQKRHLGELHQLKMQLIKEKIQYAKELHKLSVHELTLKVENERRRAEILERELSHS